MNNISKQAYLEALMAEYFYNVLYNKFPIFNDIALFKLSTEQEAETYRGFVSIRDKDREKVIDEMIASLERGRASDYIHRLIRSIICKCFDPDFMDFIQYACLEDKPYLIPIYRYGLGSSINGELFVHPKKGMSRRFSSKDMSASITDLVAERIDYMRKIQIEHRILPHKPKYWVLAPGETNVDEIKEHDFGYRVDAMENKIEGGCLYVIDASFLELQTVTSHTSLNKGSSCATATVPFVDFNLELGENDEYITAEVKMLYRIVVKHSSAISAITHLPRTFRGGKSIMGSL